jgi:hypothetical protein
MCLEHKISLHKAASEVRYIVIFNNGSTTEPNGVSELSLAPHGVAVITTKHSPAERREREPEAMPPFTHFRSPTPARSG